MIFNPIQLEQCVQARALLWRLLAQPQEDAEALRIFSGLPHITQGLTSHWLELAEKLRSGQAVSAPLPSEGHAFIEAAIGAEAHALKRLLLYVGVDLEHEWEISGQENPWSAWIWLASNVLCDGAVEQKLVQDAWTILLPELIAAGFDLDLPCKITSSPTLTRMEWLEIQDEVRLRAAIISGERLALERSFAVPSFNNASRRL